MTAPINTLLNSPSAMVNDPLSSSDCEALAMWEDVKKQFDAIAQLPEGREKQKQLKVVSNVFLQNVDDIIELRDRNERVRKEYLAHKNIIKSLGRYVDQQAGAIDKCAREYFESYFEHPKKRTIQCNFFPKNDGTQVGRKAQITRSDLNPETQPITYFIKTHQHGSVSQGSGTKAIDPKEMFVYKALEIMGLGPKTHFFFNPDFPSSFYIATQDAGYSKSLEKKSEKTFTTFATFRKTLPETEEQIPRNILVELTLVDIVTRIFRLNDLNTNESNFGFVSLKEKIKTKIVDFRIDTYVSYHAETLFQGFLSGNGLYSYYNTPFLYAIKNRPLANRVEDAKLIIETLAQGRAKKASLSSALEKAYDYVKSYFNLHKQLGVTITSKNDETHDLSRYLLDVLANFNVFQQNIEKFNIEC